MHCNPKTMIKIGVGIGTALLVAYFAFPGARALVVASAPILLALICPLMMIVMMFTMRRGDTQAAPPAQPEATDAASTAANPQPRPTAVEQA